MPHTAARRPRTHPNMKFPSIYLKLVRDSITTRKYRAAVRKTLKPLEPGLRSALARIVSHAYPANFWKVDLEVHDAAEGTPRLLAYFYAKGYDQLGLDAATRKACPFAPGKALLTARGASVRALNKQFSVDPEADWPMFAVEMEILEMVARNWKRAGGPRFQFRATLAAHDTAQRYDLVNEKWTNKL